MWFRVAALLGRTVEELRASMSSAEFSEWCAFYDLEPWGWNADNWRMSIVASTTANFSGNTRKPLKPADFLPKKPKRQQTPDQMRAAFAQVGQHG